MKKPTTEKHKKPSGQGSLSAMELQAAQKIINVLLLAWKNYSLYPEGHAASNKSLKNLENAFADYFTSNSDLRLDIERDRFLRDSDVLYKSSSGAPAEDLIFLLYRDGIKWIKFQQGIILEDLAFFFRTIARYKVLVEETEGDIVTALIDGNLEHISFKSVDIFWQDYPLINFAQLNSSLSEEGETHGIENEDIEHKVSLHRKDITAKSIADPSISESLWEISNSENDDLQKMVLEEENWDNSEDVFDVLLVILRSQTERHHFEAVLDFMAEEVINALEQGEYGALLKLFQSLHQLLYRDSTDDPAWVSPLVSHFFQGISRPQSFELVTSQLMLLTDQDTEKIKDLRQILLYFSPTVILPLGPIITQSRSSKVREMILEVIEYLCLRDMGPLEKILDHPDKELGEKLLVILSRLQGERANVIFLKMTEHASEKVRWQAVRILLARDQAFPNKLFPLIEDPDDKISREILDGIGKQKSSVLENQLVKYMKKNFDKKDQGHILACYEALGGCGSESSIPFLKRILLGQGWNKFKGYGKLVHREGAATALFLLGNWEAKDILLVASNSKFQVIRQAFQRAMAKSEATGGNTDA